jgi:DNA-binding NarL/FixJ family response regulator
MKSPVSIVIIDDHTLFLKGLMHLIRASVPEAGIRTFRSLAGLYAEKQILKSVDLIICDIELPGEDVFSFFGEVKQLYPHLPVLIISMHHKLVVVRNCKMLGIEGYILKDEDELLLLAIKCILSGKTFYSPRVEAFDKQFDHVLGSLTTREKDVIAFIAQGLSNKEISERIFVSIETVKTHKKNIKLKLGTDSARDMVNFARSNFLM